MAVWMVLNLFDLLITYWAVGMGGFFETNPVMAVLLRYPPLAVMAKFLVTFVVMWAADRIQRRTPFSGAWPLVAVNLYVGWVCVHNVLMLAGYESSFLRYYPLAGLPW